MKKILSLFLASMILLSVFAGVTVSAASEFVGDGGTLYYKIDFENSANDTINGAVPGNDKPTQTLDETTGNKYGQIVGKLSAMTLSVPLITDSSDRYVISELDIRKDATSKPVYVQYRTEDTKANNSFHGISEEAITDWQHMVFVLDRVPNASGKYPVKVFSVSNGTYTDITQSTYATRHTSNVYDTFRINITAGDVIDIDNLELKTYPNFYEAVNSASSADVINNVADKYQKLGFITMPTAYSQLTAEQKLSVAGKLLNKNFASDTAVIAAMELAVNSELIVTKYYDWDFEDNTLTDSVVGLSFMAQSVSATETDLVVAADPTNGDNRVAKIDFRKNGNSRYNDGLSIDSNEFKYLTYSFKVYLEGENSGTVSFSTLGTDSTNATRVQILADSFSGNQWHDLKIVVDTGKNVANVYEIINGNMVLVKQREFSAFNPSRIRIDRSGNERDLYYDDFEITGYKDVVSTINTISADDVASTLELYNDIGIVELPASYASLDNSAKAALGAYIKANTTASTTTAALNEAITLYLSNDELVVLSSDATASALNGLKLAVKKDGVSLVGAKLIVAAYDGTELVSVKVCDVAADGTATGLNVDISSADSVKLMLVNNITAMVPAVKATAWK